MCGNADEQREERFWGVSGEEDLLIVRTMTHKLIDSCRLRAAAPHTSLSPSYSRDHHPLNPNTLVLTFSLTFNHSNDSILPTLDYALELTIDLLDALCPNPLALNIQQAQAHLSGYAVVQLHSIVLGDIIFHYETI